MFDFAITIDALPYCEIAGRVEIIVHSFGSGPSGFSGPPENYDPGEPADLELGRIEQVINHVTEANGKRRWIHGPFPSDALGKALEEAVREALEGDAKFMEEAMTYALENAASEREEAMERRAEERRDERLMDQYHRENAA